MLASGSLHVDGECTVTLPDALTLTAFLILAQCKFDARFYDIIRRCDAGEYVHRASKALQHLQHFHMDFTDFPFRGVAA